MEQVLDYSRVIGRLRGAFRAQIRITAALMLLDMRTRFGRSHLSFLLALAWPLVHVLAIYFTFIIVSRVIPMGGSPNIFIATGALPYVLVLYPARVTTLAILQNRQALMFPVIKTTDIIIARAVVEFFSACLVVLIFSAVLAATGVDIVPLDWPEALTAVLASIYLGLGLGLLNVILMTLVRLWLIVFVSIMLLLYITAGVTSIRLAFTDQWRDVLSYNPVLHSVIWMRTAYYGDFSEIALSKSYVIAVATVCTFLGVAGDRLLRGRVLLG